MDNDSLGPCVLEGKHVILRPLEKDDAEEILEAGKGVNWSWMPIALENIEAVSQYIDWANKYQNEGRGFPFVVIDCTSGRITGSTMYLDLYPAPRRIEIGWTWYSLSAQGTKVNPECKYLLMKHAFEDWNAVRVQLKTDVENYRSRNAILKLGAKFEGRLRNHRFNRDSVLGDAMMYSITNEEWPTVRQALELRIG